MSCVVISVTCPARRSTVHRAHAPCHTPHTMSDIDPRQGAGHDYEATATSYTPGCPTGSWIARWGKGVSVCTCHHVTDRRPAELPGEHCPSAAYDCQLIYEPC